jgi:CheY-like chemotaxis protein
MSSSSFGKSRNALHNGHSMLLYDNNDKRENIVIDYINEGLRNGCLCIYASVDIGDSKGNFFIDRLSFRIINYKDHIRNGNLQFINFKPYYESALNGDLTLFDELKLELEYTLSKRILEGKKGEILAFADAACTLSNNRQFKECIVLEKWWQDTHSDWIRNNKKITVVCPHPNYGFKDSEQDIKNNISDLHTFTIDIENTNHLQSIYNSITKQSPIIKILIAESEPDIRYLYREYLNGLGIEVEIVENGNKCIEYLLDSKDKEGFFDMVILDSHLRDISGIDVLKNIRKKMPNQRIVFTTTYSLNQISDTLDSYGIENEDILFKPFNFKALLATIKPRTTNLQ